MYTTLFHHLSHVHDNDCVERHDSAGFVNGLIKDTPQRHRGLISNMENALLHRKD